MKRSNRLEAVTVCVGMDDLLHETAKWNSHQFDRWIIVTEPSDEKTREVCRKFNLECLQTEDGKRHGKPFNKGRMVERGKQLLSEDAWRIHLDCDIGLPNGFRHLIQSSDLHEDFIYGADRIDVVGWDKWQKLQGSGFMNHSVDFHCRVQMPSGFQMGTRWAHPKFGYVPIGFFQLWHSSKDEWRGVGVRPYPMEHNTACRSDVQFGLLWDKNKRALIPELIVAHLMTPDTKKGTNWNGRQSKRFGPDWYDWSSPPKNMGS